MLDTLFYRTDSLFDQLTSLQQALTRSLAGDGTPNAIRSVAAGSFPGINVGRTAKTVEVYAFAPGLEANSIDVTVERGVLRISGERRADAVLELQDDALRAARADARDLRQRGRVLRRDRLPDAVGREDGVRGGFTPDASRTTGRTIDGFDGKRVARELASVRVALGAGR